MVGSPTKDTIHDAGPRSMGVTFTGVLSTWNNRLPQRAVAPSFRAVSRQTLKSRVLGLHSGPVEPKAPKQPCQLGGLRNAMEEEAFEDAGPHHSVHRRDRHRVMLEAERSLAIASKPLC